MGTRILREGGELLGFCTFLAEQAVHVCHFRTFLVRLEDWKTPPQRSRLRRRNLKGHQRLHSRSPACLASKTCLQENDTTLHGPQCTTRHHDLNTCMWMPTPPMSFSTRLRARLASQIRARA